MDHSVDKAFRKVHDMQGPHASSFSFFQSRDIANRESVYLVGCVCESMDSCPFLLLWLQGPDDVEMDGSQ